MIDTEALQMLRQSLEAWRRHNAGAFERMEAGALDADLWSHLFTDLDEMGVLHVLYERETRHDLHVVAEVAHGLAQASPSLAVLVVQQNVAAGLLGEAGAPAPTGWLSMPLYDGCGEWPTRIRVGADADGLRLEGSWGLLPGLPIASELVLPLVPAGPDSFVLVRIDLTESRRCLGAVVPTLGLSGCPVADATFAGEHVPASAFVMDGRAAHAAVHASWSQAELLVQAIRSAIVDRSYAVAHAYAEGRWQGKKPIVQHSLVRQLLADLYGAKMALEEQWRSGLLSLEPGRALGAGQLSAAVRCATTASHLASDGIQLLGGYGYVEEYGQGRLFRDAKQCEMLLGHPQAKLFGLWEASRPGAG